MKFLYIVPLAASLLLGGCATTGTATTIEQIRQAAVAACGFLPTVQTVAAILAAGNPSLIVADAVATAICSAVSATTPQARRKGVVPTVNGVVIHGKFVR